MATGCVCAETWTWTCWPGRTEAQIDETVRGLICDIAPGGGYILTSGNSLSHYCLPENAIGMAAATKKYGLYQIRD
jgi:hypothetical protein